IPVVIHELDDREALELAIVENVQRADLDAIEEARGYQRLIEEFGYAQGDLAKVIGKSRPHVANTLRLLQLSHSTRRLVSDGEISAGHARALLSVKSPEAVAARIVAEGLTVRDVERIAQKEAESTGTTSPRAKKREEVKDADTRAVEKAMTDALGLTTVIHSLGGERVDRVLGHGEVHPTVGGEIRADVALVILLRFLAGQAAEKGADVVDGQRGLLSDGGKGSPVGAHQRLQRRVVARDASGIRGNPHGGDLKVVADPGQHRKALLGRDLFGRERAADVGGVEGAVPKAPQVHLIVARNTRDTLHIAVGVQAVFSQDDPSEAPGGCVGRVDRQPASMKLLHGFHLGAAEEPEQ